MIRIFKIIEKKKKNGMTGLRIITTTDLIRIMGMLGLIKITEKAGILIIGTTRLICMIS